MLLNAFHTDVIHRAQIAPPHLEIEICATYITDTRDCFCLTFKYEDCKYRMYMIDLDACNVDEFDGQEVDLNHVYNMRDPILAYHEDKVLKKPFVQMHVRGSSRKENIDFNEKLILLLLHGDTLYSWTQTMGQQKYDLNFIQRISSKALYPKNDYCVYFRQDTLTENEEQVIFEEIRKIEINFSTFEISTVYIETSLVDVLLSVNYDKNADKLILFLRSEGGNPNK